MRVLIIDYGEIAATLRQLRTDANETLAEVAAQTGLSISHLSEIERGKGTLSFTVVHTLVRHYGYSPFFALRKDSNETEDTLR